MRKMAWVKWDKVLNIEKVGGLNIGSLKVINWALLAKWWWRFRVESNRPWVKIIKSIHGEDGGLTKYLSPGKGNGGKWIDIIKIGKDIEKTGINFYKSFGKKNG